MPFLRGESLREKLVRERELPVPEVARILRDVADALAHARKAGVVHRDIKPENILLSGRHALVTDFGVAKALAASQRPEHPKDAKDSTPLTTLGVGIGDAGLHGTGAGLGRPADGRPGGHLRPRLHAVRNARRPGTARPCSPGSAGAPTIGRRPRSRMTTGISPADRPRPPRTSGWSAASMAGGGSACHFQIRGSLWRGGINL